jgi:hypothetical protein
MRSLNGNDYTVLFIAKPVNVSDVSTDISKLISIRDQAFAVSKRNIARSNNHSITHSHTDNVNDGKSSTAGQIGAAAGASVGAVAGSFIPMIELASEPWSAVALAR